jgi:putative FmdB family regulatory protein
MPYYEYRCSDCTSQFELMRSISQRDETAECPQCESMNCSRMFAMPVMFSQGAGGQMQAVAGTSSSSCGSCRTLI